MVGRHYSNLETVHISSDFNLIDCRFPVQSVIRPHTMEHKTFAVMQVELMEVFLSQSDRSK